MANILLVTLLVILITNILLTNGQIPGGYSPVSPDQYGKLEKQLQSSNLGEVLKNHFEVKKVLSAQQQVVAGMNYQILAEVENGCDIQQCCIKAFRSLQGKFSVCCANCGSKTCQYSTCLCK